MFEHFSAHAAMALAIASRQAERLHHDAVDTGHVLLALMDEESGLLVNAAAGAALRDLGVDIERARKAVERLAPPGAHMGMAGHIPRSGGAKRALDAAFDDSLTLDTGCVGTEHLLMGILRDDRSVAARALAEEGLTLAEVRAWVLKRVNWRDKDMSQQKKNAARAAVKLPSRRLDELTSREVEFWMKEGGDLALVPFGPSSGHGALISLGIHAHWAHALALLIAERANGLVYPPIYTVYSGATRTFKGAVSVPIREQVGILMRVAKTLYDQGFKRTVLVAGTNPENYGGMVAARELFDNTEIPFWMIEGEKLIHLPEARAIYEGYPGNFGETLIGLASLKILGRERPIPCPSWSKELKPDDGEGDQPAEITKDVNLLRSLGAIGWRYHEEKNHGNHGTAGIAWKGRSDIDMAVEVLEKCADLVVPALSNLEHYQSWLAEHPLRFIRATDRLDEPL